MRLSTGRKSPGRNLFAPGVLALLGLSLMPLSAAKGSGSTISNSHLGNLIIGYNASRTDPNTPDVRLGSHNLVLGDNNNYASSGGVVAGAYNFINSPYAVISGGNYNTVAGQYSSISGGAHHFARGEGSSISGGTGNFVDNLYSSISGGSNNGATGMSASVSGGSGNQGGDDNGWAAGAPPPP